MVISEKRPGGLLSKEVPLNTSRFYSVFLTALTIFSLDKGKPE
jgi:hypothetical protein